MRIRLAHLVLLIAVSTVVAGIGGVFATYWVIEDEMQDLLDDDLEAQSQLLARLFEIEGGLASPEQLERLILSIFEPDQEETLWVTIYDPASRTLVSNLEHALPPDAQTVGPLELEFQGYRWLGYQHGRPDGPIVRLLHRMDRYEEVREEVLDGVAIPALIVVVVNLLLLGGLTYLFLGPLTRLARDLEQRRPDSLEPVAITTPAHEVLVLRDALNKLMADVDGVLSRERAFASDVAHELRTPLTTLKLELSSSEPDWTSLKSEVDRLIALVTQLLTLARLQRAQWRQSFDLISLDSLYASLLRELNHPLDAAGIRLRTDLASTTVMGDRMLLEILLRNLVSNVIRHCPAGSELHVRLSEADDGVLLQVDDTGTGMEAHEREHVNSGVSRMERRGAGLGLGLTICHKIAEVHGATLSIHARSDGASGLAVRVRFPRLRSS